MNKRYLYIFCIVGLFLVTLVAALLIDNVGKQPEDKHITTIASTDESLLEGETTNLSTGDSQTELTGETEKEPSFKIDFGVGERPALDTTTAPQKEQTTQSTSSTGKTQPTQGQNSEATQLPVDEENGMPNKLLTYEEFLALSNAQQQAYFYLFEDPLKYAQWLQKAQQEYEDGKTSITVTGPVDLSTLPAERK